METIRHQLEASSIFSLFPSKTLDVLEKAAISQQVKKSTWVVHQGEIWPYLLLVHEGTINATKDSPEGRTLIAASFTKGDVFWGVSFFDQKYLMPAGLIAYEDLKLILWHRDVILPYILQEGSVAWELSRTVVERLLLASEKIGDMTFQPVEVRLAKLLLNISKNDQGIPIVRSLTLDEMAARIGTTREVVCRILHKYSDNGIIDINRTEFTITNSDELNMIAQIN